MIFSKTKSPDPTGGPGPGGSFSRPGLAIPCRVARQPTQGTARPNGWEGTGVEVIGVV